LEVEGLLFDRMETFDVKELIFMDLVLRILEFVLNLLESVCKDLIRNFVVIDKFHEVVH
jgi:hypothetical protein